LHRVRPGLDRSEAILQAERKGGSKYTAGWSNEGRFGEKCALFKKPTKRSTLPKQAESTGSDMLLLL
jgi:hypothetical protein